MSKATQRFVLTKVWRVGLFHIVLHHGTSDGIRFCVYLLPRDKLSGECDLDTKDDKRRTVVSPCLRKSAQRRTRLLPLDTSCSPVAQKSFECRNRVEVRMGMRGDPRTASTNDCGCSPQSVCNKGRCISNGLTPWRNPLIWLLIDENIKHQLKKRLLFEQASVRANT